MKFGLIGHPVSHSLSKCIHEANFDAIGIGATYDLIDLPSLDLTPTKSLLGYNVTVPYKEAILTHLDHIDEKATKIGAVNTIMHLWGKSYATNTDGAGFAKSLDIPTKNLQALVVGAGGTARSIIYELLEHGATVDVANRTLSKAHQIKEQIGSRDVLSLEQAADKVPEYNLIVN
ncbi:MAG TPA: shikimate dehydrogenase, partial [Acidobacteriota bacterium]|nr:shikimate dehydrogenase [Acidobacteriota bacterium]